MEKKDEIILHSLNKKIAAIHVPEWDWDFNLDDLVRIDYSNIFGEIITIPVLENQVGWLLAEITNYYKEQKLNLEYKEAEVRKLFRNEKSSNGHKAPTIQEVDDHLTLDPVIKNLRLKLLKIEKNKQEIEALYEAVKSKSFKLNNLSKSLKPEEYEKELIESKVNGVIIKIKEKRYSR